MPVSQMHHPDLDKLTAFGLGLLSEADSAEIELHLSNCDECCQKLEYLPADSLVDLLQASEADTPSDLSHAIQTVDSGLPAPAPASLPPLYKKLANIVAGKPAGQAVQPSLAKVAAFHAHKIPQELQGHSRYEVLEPLGAGGMGAVYKAKHRLMDRIVALKIVNPLLVTKPGAVERFIREVKAAAQLAHPNIVTAYDAEKIGEMHVLVMEYVEGETLGELLQQQDVLGVAQACDYVRQTALGLQHAVDCGMVHRDIKPLNLMLTKQRAVKILDFGLARFVSEQRPLEGSTEQGSMMGSPDYMAPEQARDAHTADARADIYSLGCTLYQLLAGQVPFPGLPLLEKLEAHRDQQPPALNQIRVDVPADLERIIAKMMAKAPDQRYQTPAEVAEALLPFTQARRTHAPLDAKPSKPAVERKPKSKLPVAMAIVAALLLAAIGYWAAQVVLRVETPQGTLIVTTDDPDVQISVKSGGKEVALFFPQQKKEVQLEIGAYTLELVGGQDGMKLSTNKFEIKSGNDEKTVTVEFVPTVAEKKTPNSVEKAETQTGFALPEIPSVEELLKTREVLTVAQDGSGGYTTITAALEKVQTGQAVRVMDKGPYREFLSKELPADVALVSLVGTRIEIPNYTSYAEATEKGKFLYYGAWLNAPNFRLSGFEWVGTAPRPENLGGGALLRLGANGDMVVERCSFQAPDYLTGLTCFTLPDTPTWPAKPARLLVQDNVAYQCLEFLEFPGSLTVQRNWISSPREGLSFNQRAGSLLIRNNIVNANWAIYFNGIPVNEARSAPGLDLRIDNNVLEATNPIGFFRIVPDKATCVLHRSASIANNIIRSRVSSGVLMIPEDMALVKDRWEIGPNVYQSEPKKTPGSPYESWPTGPGDQILPKHFLSVEPNNADYLRIAADGTLATGGAGGDLPTYFGAFPPGPAPKEGDWFTRLLEIAKVSAAPPVLKAASVKELLAKAQAATEQKQYEQAIGHCNEVLRQDPNNIEAVYLRASPQWNLGKADLAIQDVTAVLKLNPDHDNARHNRAFYYLNTGKPDECIADVNILLSRDKTSGAAAGAFANRGAAWAGKGRFEKGLADFEAAIKITPTYAMGHHWQGIILERLGDHAKAKIAFAAAVKFDKGFATRRTNQLDHVIPQPMPLTEWREGREFITVAQTGPADYRTIQEALYACKAGQYVKVLDKGPYRETIIYSRAATDMITDIALVSDVGTRIEVPHWREWGVSPTDKNKKIYQGCVLISANGLRLSGFEFRLPPLLPDTDYVVAVEFAGAGDLIVESCQIRYHRDVVSGLPAEEKEQFGRFVALIVGWSRESTINKGRFLVQDNLIDGKVELRAKGPVQVTVQRNWIRAGHPQPSLELPYHAETESAVGHNVIQGYNGIALRGRGPEKTAATAGRYLIANNLIEVEVAPFWASGPVKEQEDRQALSRWVTIQNNVLRSKGRYGLQLHADDLKAMTGVWKIGHNCFRTEPIQTTTNGGLPVIAKQPTDLIVAGPFLSDDPQQADYPRIAADGRLAASGVGGNLPSYIGPLPPGPAPTEGDWFTRLREGDESSE